MAAGQTTECLRVTQGHCDLFLQSVLSEGWEHEHRENSQQQRRSINAGYRYHKPEALPTQQGGRRFLSGLEVLH